MVLKKRKSKRLSTRKKNKILKKIRKQEKDRRKTFKEKLKNKSKIPKQILMTDEELIRLQEIKDNEKRRKDLEIGQIQIDTNIDNFCKANDFIIYIVDPRDIIMPNFNVDCIVINYRNDISLELLGSLFNKINNNFKCFILSKDCSDEKINRFKDEFLQLVSKLQNKSIGIIGQPKVGKNFIRKLIDQNEVTTYTTHCEQGLSGLLRGAINYRNVLYKDLIKDLVDNKIDKDQLSHYYKIRYFENFDDFVGLIAEKEKIRSNKDEEVSKMIINEFYNGKFKFYKDDEGQFVFLI